MFLTVIIIPFSFSKKNVNVTAFSITGGATEVKYKFGVKYCLKLSRPRVVYTIKETYEGRNFYG